MRVRYPSWVASFLCSGGGRATGPVVMASAAAIPLAQARLATVMVGGTVVALSHVFVQRRVEDLERASADTLEDEICDMLVHNITLLEHLKRLDGGLFRASVLMVDPSRHVLALKMCSHGFTDDDRLVVWAKGEGPPGLAWQLGRPIIAPRPRHVVPRAQGAQHIALCGTYRSRDGGQTREGGTANALSPTQLHFLDQVEMMVCYPIIDLTHPNRVLGVLVLDDRLPPGPHLEDVLSAVEFLRDQIRRRLTTMYVVGNGA